MCTNFTDIFYCVLVKKKTFEDITWISRSRKSKTEKQYNG